MSDFDDIRPIHDDEVSEVLSRLARSKELIHALIEFRFSRWPKWIKAVMAAAIGFASRRLSKRVHYVRELQNAVAPYMERMIKKTTREFTITGLNDHDMTKPCLFISNHRDIALDPAFVNWALYVQGYETIRIAIGDNLLSQPWISDLMRLNKSFIVNRSASSKREKLTAAKQLSAYIAFSLFDEKEHIWIAQKEGRAKDGNDVTNPAIISMLALNKAKEAPLSDYLNDLHVVPVSISYEYDPCDIVKAKEMVQLETHGRYDKVDREDINSISTGITGFKGGVHVHFGVPIKDVDTTRDFADRLDEQIHKNYYLFPSNIAASQLLGWDMGKLVSPYDEQALAQARLALQSRLEGLDAPVIAKVLAMYAMPVMNKSKRA